MSKQTTLKRQLLRDIERHKKVAKTTVSASSRTRAVNLVNQKLRMLKTIESNAPVSDWIFNSLGCDERFRLND